MKFECPHCAQYIACDEKHAGELIFCPKCEGEMIIPQPAPPTAPTETPSTRATLQCPYCSAAVVLPAEDLDDMVGKVLRCSECRKRIDVAAEEPAPEPEPQQPETPEPAPEPEAEAKPRPVVKVKKKVVRIPKKQVSG